MKLAAAAILVSAGLVAGCAAKRPASAPDVAPPAAPVAEAASPPASEPQRFADTPQAGSLQEEFAAIAGDRVFFDVDSNVLRADALAILQRQAEWLAARPQLSVLIAGNCDERGTREYNLALGAERAQAVHQRLTSLGVSPTRIRTISYGKERPIDAGSTEAAWSRNRNAHTLVEG